MAVTKTHVWHSLETNKPPHFDLVMFKDEQGKEQAGWWDGWQCCFRVQKIGTPIEYKRGPIYTDLPKTKELPTPRIYTFCTDGRKHTHRLH